jgi:hypothetical protein
MPDYTKELMRSSLKNDYLRVQPDSEGTNGLPSGVLAAVINELLLLCMIHSLNKDVAAPKIKSVECRSCEFLGFKSVQISLFVGKKEVKTGWMLQGV